MSIDLVAAASTQLYRKGLTLPRATAVSTVLGLTFACSGVLFAQADPPVPTGQAFVNGPLLKEALDGAMAGRSEIAFVVRAHADDGHYYNPFPKLGGGRLCRLDLRTGKVTTILDAGPGVIRDAQVHYDGRKILFGFAREGAATADARYGNRPVGHFSKLYEIGADGSGLRQITPDAPFHDIEPTYLPDGGVAFCSSRARRVVGCRTNVESLLLFRCDGDGQNLRPLSSGAFTENTPAVLPDGRIVYTRWEYVDRKENGFHTLWTMNPDGTGTMTLFGNMHHLGDRTICSARAMPGTSWIVAVFGAHTKIDQYGYVRLIDLSHGPDDEAHVRKIEYDGQDDRGRAKRIEVEGRDPYPLSSEWLLVAHEARLLLVHVDGRREVLYDLYPGVKEFGKDNKGKVVTLPPFFVHDPQPLTPRPREAVVPPRVDLTQGTGRLVLQDVTRGRNMQGVRPGEIRRLLVLEQPPMPAHTGGTQACMSNGGAYSVKRVLGTVPVEADGSAYFEAPAMRSLFFVALDENDRSVKRMQSFVTLMPGETTGCVGCHEHRTETPRPAAGLLALRRGPSRIEAAAGVPDIFDFRRDVQPVLDRHCAGCHNPQKPEGRELDLTSAPDGKEKNWTRSYAALTRRKDARKQEAGEPLYIAFAPNAAGNYPPRTLGSGASRLLKFVDGSHYDAKLSQVEYDTIRLWIEVGATFYGHYGVYDRWADQMTRYSVTPVTDSEGKTDPFATEKRYWESFQWMPRPPANRDPRE
jgi:hypothetical protein